MDEIVNLASFEFDVTRLNANVDSLRGKMFELGKQQEANKNAMREYQKEINELNKVQKLLENANGESSDAYKENEGRIQALTAAQKANYKVQQDLTQQIKKVGSELTTTTQMQNAYNTSTGQQTTLLNATNKALETNVNNINEARASNKEILAIRNQLNPAIEEEAAQITKLNARLDENNAFIKENASAYEQQKINIGNYTDSIREAAASISPLNGGLSGFIGRAQEAGGVAPLLTGAFAAMRTGIIGMTQAGLAFIATPIGAALAALAVVVAVVVGAFKFMTASMNSTEEGSQKLAKITGTISGLFNGFFKVLKPFGEFLGNVFIAYIEGVGEALDTLATGLGNAAEFLGMDGVAESIRGVQTEVKQSAVAAMELAEAEGELAEAQRESRKTQLQFQKDAEKLRQLRDDESKTVAERIKINDQLGVVLQNQLDAELKLAEVALKVANARLKSEGRTAEALDAQAAAQTEIIDIQERIASQESEQLASLNSLRKEAATQEKERQQKAAEARQKVLDDAVQKIKEETDYYIASQGDKKRSLDDQLKYEQEISSRRLAILEKEYAAGKLSKRAYETEKLNITNELLQKQTEATIANADLELKNIILDNQKKIDANQFYSDAVYQQELDRIKRVNDAESAALKLRLDNGLLNQKEYDLALRELEIKAQGERDTATREREAAQNEKEAADLAIQRELDNTNWEYDFEEKERRLLEERAKEREIAVRAGADMEAFDKLTTQKQKDLAKEVMDNKLELAGQTFANLATIFGKESAAGKALAIAQATMDTFRAANAAYASLATIPVVGPALGAVAAGAAVASGLANVKKITSTKEAKIERPSYARGVIGLSGAGTGDSDSIPVNLSKGESVITAEGTSMFPELLSAINQMGGGVGLNASSSILSQQSITQGADNSEMSAVIANAVYEGSLMGTMRGSESGIVGLSNNRQIQANALN